MIDYIVTGQYWGNSFWGFSYWGGSGEIIRFYTPSRCRTYFIEKEDRIYPIF